MYRFGKLCKRCLGPMENFTPGDLLEEAASQMGETFKSEVRLRKLLFSGLFGLQCMKVCRFFPSLLLNLNRFDPGPISLTPLLKDSPPVLLLRLFVYVPAMGSMAFFPNDRSWWYKFDGPFGPVDENY